LTGSLALLGTENLNGAKIAVDMINEQGGIAGNKIELVTGDASTPDKAQSEAERLSSLENLKVITGTYSSGLSFAASQVVERRGGIYWETGGISDGLTKRGFKNYFRVVFTASQNGQLAAGLAKDVIAKSLKKDVKDIKIMVIHEDSDYGTSVATAAETRAKELGFAIAAKTAYKATSTDLSPLILRMKAEAPNIVIASSYATDALLIQLFVAVVLLIQLWVSLRIVVEGCNVVRVFCNLRVAEIINNVLHLLFDELQLFVVVSLLVCVKLTRVVF
jgi:branched-chain amino acid transport system substrate-binding protein